MAVGVREMENLKHFSADFSADWIGVEEEIGGQIVKVSPDHFDSHFEEK